MLYYTCKLQKNIYEKATVKRYIYSYMHRYMFWNDYKKQVYVKIYTKLEDD